METLAETTPEIIVPLAALERAQERVKKLARRAKRLGLAEPKLHELGACAWRVRIDDEFYAGRRWRVIPGVVVQVEGERPVLPGHKLLGTIEPVGDDFLVFAAPDGEDRDLRQYADKRCDHCKTRRNRKLLVLVEHEDGTVLRVGRECVQSYLPGISVDQLVEASSYARSIGEFAELDDIERQPRVTVFDVATFVECAFAAVRVDGGYVSTSAGPGSTRDVALDIYRVLTQGAVTKHERETAERYLPFEESDKLLATAALDWARNLDPKGNDFLTNLNVVARAAVLPFRRAGIAAAVVPGFNRDLVKRTEKRERVSEHVGTIGKREVFKNLQCVVAYPIDGYYGPSTIFVFTDEKGRSLKWKASGEPRIEKGWSYDIRGTVKDHDEYKGTKQTVLSRCKIEATHEPESVTAARKAREEVA